MLNYNAKTALITIIMLISTLFTSGAQAKASAHDSQESVTVNTVNNDQAINNHNTHEKNKKKYSHLMNPIPNLYLGARNLDPKQFGKGVAGALIYAAIFWGSSTFASRWYHSEYNQRQRAARQRAMDAYNEFQRIHNEAGAEYDARVDEAHAQYQAQAGEAHAAYQARAGEAYAQLQARAGAAHAEYERIYVQEMEELERWARENPERAAQW